MTNFPGLPVMSINKGRFNKALGVVFAMVLLAGCASTDTQDTSEAEAAAAAARAAEQAERDRQARLAREAAEREAQQLEYVFYFDFDKATLRADVRAALDKHIRILRDNNQRVRLEGHTDERGTREYNMALGERRANSVASYLIANGIARNRIETVSYGEERPIAFGQNEDAWQRNRRVELKLN